MVIDDDDVVVVNYGNTTPDYNHNVGADYDIENDDDDDDDLYALIMLLCHLNYVLMMCLCHLFNLRVP